MSNMTEADWEIWLRADGDQPQPPEELKTIKGKNVHSFIGLGRKTHKAKFFITNEGIGGTFGFWLPKAAIVEQLENEVKVADWCTVKIIEFS